MSKSANPVPEGYHTVTPYLVVKGAPQAIEFYKKAFGARELCRMFGPDGRKVMHAEVQIGSSRLMLADEVPEGGWVAPQNGMSPVTIHLYVEDADATFNRAVEVGATVRMPLADMFWGDRFGTVTDPFGHSWSIATHKEDVPPEQMQERAKAAFSACP
jgi:uncharacterized glyoxalase superfamily protein PhnB